MAVATALGLLVVGLVILIAGAEWFVKGAASLAQRAGMPAIVVGLTVVSLGTSSPELVVNLFAALGGSSDLAVGNIVGSNIANILLILGISGIIAPLAVKHTTTWREIPIALLAALLLFVFASDFFFDNAQLNTISRVEGFAFISLFALFLAYVYSLARSESLNDDDDVPSVRSLNSTLVFLVVGLAALVGGGKLLVDNAVILATLAGLSEAFIGLTIVAIGTSLPELATSAIAAWRGHTDIAIGNVVGSSIFNIFWILGITAIVLPLPVSPELTSDIAFSFGATLLLFTFMFTGKRHRLERWESILFVTLYIVYIALLIMRG